MPLTYSDHARREMERRAIPEEWVFRVMEFPSRAVLDPIDPMLMRAYAPIAEMGDRALCVVYHFVDYHVVTVFFERRLRGRL